MRIQKQHWRNPQEPQGIYIAQKGKNLKVQVTFTYTSHPFLLGFQVADYHKSFYRPENLVVIITGTIDKEQVFKKLQSVGKRIDIRI